MTHSQRVRGERNADSERLEMLRHDRKDEDAPAKDVEKDDEANHAASPPPLVRRKGSSDFAPAIQRGGSLEDVGHSHSISRNGTPELIATCSQKRLVRTSVLRREGDREWTVTVVTRDLSAAIEVGLRPLMRFMDGGLHRSLHAGGIGHSARPLALR